MKIEDVALENYTVFSCMNMNFSKGINVFIGENGTGKTHLMKLLYAAGYSANGKISFPYKLVKTMLPDGFKISRLSTRTRGNVHSRIQISAVDDNNKKKNTLRLDFSNRNKKWDAKVIGGNAWERYFSGTSLIFIPAKEVLSNNYNLNAAVEKGNVQFDDTYLDILTSAKIDITKGRDEKFKRTILREIEQIMDGKVQYDASKDEFYLKKGRSKQEFNLISEGIRKLALLWQLIKNGVLDNGSILFWDEPEANINPSAIPIIARLLLVLQQNGVQIFLSTHDYFLSKYIDVNRKSTDKVQYISLYWEQNNLKADVASKFSLLEHNKIMQTFISLYREEVEVSLR